MDEELKRQLDDILGMLERGDTDSAVRESGEIFSRANNRCAADNTPENMSRLALTAISHIQALTAAGFVRDGFETACSMLYLISDSRTRNSETDYALIPLGVEAVSLLMQALPQMFPAGPDENAREHSTVVASILASLLYHNYIAYHDIHPEAPATTAARQIINDMIQARMMQAPTIQTPDGDVAPTDTEPVFAELIGRARALGFFAEQ